MAEETTAAETMTADERRLHELGYAQELRRSMSGFSNFAVSFTIISILSGCGRARRSSAAPGTWAGGATWWGPSP